MKKYLLSLLFVVMFVVGAGPVSKAASLDWNSIVKDKKAGVYELKSLLKEESHLIAAGVYDENHLLLVRETKKGTRTVRLLSLTDGSIKTVTKHKVKKIEFFSGYMQYHIISYNPLIIGDSQKEEYQIYADDFSSYNTVKTKDADIYSMRYSKSDNSLYYTNAGEQSLEKTEFSGNTVSGSAITVWEPPVNVGNCKLDEISEDGTTAIMRATEMQKDKNIRIFYNLTTGTYTKILKEPNYYADWQSGDTKNAFFVSFGNPKGNPYTYYDFAKKKKYIYQSNIKGMNGLYYNARSFDYNNRLVFGYYKGDGIYLKNILIWDISKAKAKKCTKKEIPVYKKTSITKQIDYGTLTKTAEKMEKKYGVEIILGKNCPKKIVDYKAKPILKKKKIKKALKALDTALAAYPEGFFKELSEDFTPSVNFYLTGTLTEINRTRAFSAGGITGEFAEHQSVAVDINYIGLEGTFIHEITHVIDNWFAESDYSAEMENKWLKGNPKKFEYYNSYSGYEFDYKYTMFYKNYMEKENHKKIYFYDDYSKTYATEDRARLFEFLIPEKKPSFIYKSKHIKKKMKSYYKMLDKCFETVSMDAECALISQYKKWIA